MWKTINNNDVPQSTGYTSSIASKKVSINKNIFICVVFALSYSENEICDIMQNADLNLFTNFN